MRTLALLAAVSLILAAPIPSSLLAADAPTTKPAPKPLPPLDAKNSVEASIEGRPATWRVYKGWKEQQLSGGVARSWVVPPAPKNVNEPIKTFTVSILSGGKPDATIEGAADLNKQALQQRDPELKIVKDEAIDFAGGKGWVLVYDTVQTGTVRDDKGKETRVKTAVRSQRILSLHGGYSATLTFTCAPGEFDKLLRNVERAFGSFAWKD
jgi:hypothetical protein